MATPTVPNTALEARRKLEQTLLAYNGRVPGRVYTPETIGRASLRQLQDELMKAERSIGKSVLASKLATAKDDYVKTVNAVSSLAAGSPVAAMERSLRRQLALLSKQTDPAAQAVYRAVYNAGLDEAGQPTNVQAMMSQLRVLQSAISEDPAARTVAKLANELEKAAADDARTSTNMSVAEYTAKAGIAKQALEDAKKRYSAAQDEVSAAGYTPETIAVEETVAPSAEAPVPIADPEVIAARGRAAGGGQYRFIDGKYVPAGGISQEDEALMAAARAKRAAKTGIPQGTAITELLDGTPAVLGPDEMDLIGSGMSIRDAIAARAAMDVPATAEPAAVEMPAVPEWQSEEPVSAAWEIPQFLEPDGASASFNFPAAPAAVAAPATAPVAAKPQVAVAAAKPQVAVAAAKPRAGTPRVFTDEQIQSIVSGTETRKPIRPTQWFNNAVNAVTGPGLPSPESLVKPEPGRVFTNALINEVGADVRARMNAGALDTLQGASDVDVRRGTRLAEEAADAERRRAWREQVAGFLAGLAEPTDIPPPPARAAKASAPAAKPKATPERPAAPRPNPARKPGETTDQYNKRRREEILAQFSTEPGYVDMVGRPLLDAATSAYDAGGDLYDFLFPTFGSLPARAGERR